MKAIFRVKSIKRKMFVSYMIVLIIPFLGFGMLGYWWTVKIVKEQTETMYREKLDQARSIVDKRFLDMDQLAQTLVGTRWVQKIGNMYGPTIQSDRLEPSEIGGYADEIRNYESLNGFIDRIAIILNTKQLVLTNNGLDDYAWFFEKNYKLEDMEVDDWLPYINKFNHGSVLNPGQVRTYNSYKHAMTYVKTLPLIDQTPAATLLLSIEEKSIQELLHTGAYDRTHSLYILDANNNLVTGVNIDEHIRPMLNDIPDAGARITSVVKNSSGDEYFTFLTKSEVNGWKYIAVIPKSMVLSKVQVIKYAVFILLAVSVVIGILFSYGFAVRNYRPLKGLLSKLSSGMAAKHNLYSGSNEYNYLESAFDTIISSNNELERKVQVYLPMAMHSFFLKLLYNLHAPAEISYARQTIGIGTTNDAWRVALLYFESDNDESISISQKVSKWTVEGNWPLYLVEIEGNRLALILNTGDRSRAEEAISQMKQSLLEAFGEHPSYVGVGGSCTELGEISNSHKEAVMALNYAFVRDSFSDGMVFFADIDTDNSFRYYFPTDKEEELISKMRLGEFEQVEAVLSKLIERNVGNGNYHFMTLQCFFHNLLSTALKALSDTDLSISNVINEREFMRLNTINSIKEYVYNVFARVCAEMARKREADGSKVKNEIWSYIDDNCYDGSISLEAVADRFGWSVPYTSKFIKEQTGYNFVEYIARKRVAMAKQLLANQAITVEEIGLKIGYANVLTFRRAFKKYSGVTPGEYRTMKLQTKPQC